MCLVLEPELGPHKAPAAAAGSMHCFKTADNYLRGFLPIRSAVVIGNHDLEGEEFETDEANLAAWTKVSHLHCHLSVVRHPSVACREAETCPVKQVHTMDAVNIDCQAASLRQSNGLWRWQIFKQRHYWSMELGGVLCLGISTTRFRSNAFRCGRCLCCMHTHEPGQAVSESWLILRFSALACLHSCLSKLLNPSCDSKGSGGVRKTGELLHPRPAVLSVAECPRIGVLAVAEC